MKKILALMMALCMALAAVPALAESEVAGSWYLISMGMTAASIELSSQLLTKAWKKSGKAPGRRTAKP